MDGFVRLISNQAAVLFSQNKSTPAKQPNETGYTPLILDTMILGTWQQLPAETDDLSISSDSDTVNIYASPSFSIIRAEHICLNLLSLILKSFIIQYRVSFTITYNL
jgi:hypothetical protein